MKPQAAQEVYNEIVAYMKLNDGKYSKQKAIKAPIFCA